MLSKLSCPFISVVLILFACSPTLADKDYPKIRELHPKIKAQYEEGIKLMEKRIAAVRQELQKTTDNDKRKQLHKAIEVFKADKKKIEKNYRLIREDWREKRLATWEMKQDAFTFGGSAVGHGISRALYEAFYRDYKKEALVNFNYHVWSDACGMQELVSGFIEGVVVRDDLTDSQKKILAQGYPDDKRQPAVIDLGRMGLVIITNEANPVPRLTVQQVEDIYRRKIKQWSDIGIPGGTITRIGSKYPKMSASMFYAMILGRERVKPKHEPWMDEVKNASFEHTRGKITKEEFERIKDKHRDKYEKARMPYIMFNADDKVRRAVAKDKTAIGHCLHPVGSSLPDGVRMVPIVTEKGTKAVPPTDENILFEEYPLQTRLRWVIPPEPTRVCRDYIAFCTSAAAAAIIEDHYIFPARRKVRLMMERRRAAAKAGEGPLVSIAGPRDVKEVFDALSSEYVTSVAVMRGRYLPSPDISAIGRFLQKKAALLVVEGAPDQRALDVHGDAFRRLWTDSAAPDASSGRKSIPLGGAPLVLTGRAVAIVVNSAAGRREITLDRLRKLFSGVAQDAERAVLYGLPPSAAETKVLRECIGQPKVPVRAKRDTAAVIAAVSADRRGLGYVSAAALPADPSAAGVTVLAVRSGGKAVRPSAANIRGGEYPFAERLFVYVHPEAREAARDFYTFLATGGRAADTCYIDASRHVSAVYRSGGLLPGAASVGDAEKAETED